MSDELNTEESEETQEDLIAALEKDWVENPFKQDESILDPLIPTATLEIYQFIAQYLARKERGTVLRASSANLCVKRRWFDHHGYKGSDLTPRKIINFMLGDLTERIIVYFIAQANVGPGKLYSEVSFGEVEGSLHFQGKELKIYKQKTWTTKLGSLSIPGHADGIGKRNSDGKWELIEIKSSSDFGYADFKLNGPKDYLKQAHCLMMSEEARALEIQDVRFFYLKKQTGQIHDRLEHYHPAISGEVRNEFLASISDREPIAPYQLKPETMGRGKKKVETGRFTTVWQCGYCSMLEHCKGKFDIEYKKARSGGLAPVYLFSEMK